MDSEELRKEAEKRIAEQRDEQESPVGESPDTGTSGTSNSSADPSPDRALDGTSAHWADKLVHDLKVHQVELELQNEELRDAYARLEETSREYFDLFERAPMGLVVVDKHGILRRCNATFRQLLSSEGEPCDRPLADFVTPESAQTWRSRFRALFANPEEKQVDLELRTQEDHRRIIRLVGRTMDAPIGHVRRQKESGDVLMLVVSDVTEEIRAREQTQSLLAEKDLLLRELKHRTQNHLFTIQSMLSFQAGYENDPSIAAALSGAANRIQAMLLVNRILTARPEQRAVDLDTYLHDLITQIRDSYSGEASVAVQTDLDQIRVTADAGYSIGLIVNELLTNAFKYAFPTGEEGTVYVSLRRDPPDGAALVVTDTGVGLSHTDGRAEGASEAPEGASGGFGLHLVEALADQLNGTVTVENTGGGTRCCVSIKALDQP